MSQSPPDRPESEDQTEQGRLLEEALRLLDADDFAGAMVAYRAAAALGPLSWWDLTSLRITEGYEQEMHRRELTRAFPDSFEVADAQIDVLIRQRDYNWAAKRCTEWLARPNLTAKQTHQLRRARLEANRRDAALFADDFLTLWAEATPRPVAMRQSLLRRLVALDEPGLLAGIQAIGERIDDPEVRRIIAGKVEALAIFQKAKDATRVEGNARQAVRQAGQNPDQD